MSKIALFGCALLCLQWNGPYAAAQELKTAGEPPIFEAACEGNLSQVQSLIASGADVNVHNATGKFTSAMCAAAQGYVAVLSELIAAGADLNAQNTLGRTALMLAIDEGLKGEELKESEKTLAVVETLLAVEESYLFIDLADITGKTPLMVATRKGSRSVVNALLSVGASTTVVDIFDMAALDIAKWAKVDMEIIAALELADPTGCRVFTSSNLPFEGATPLHEAAYKGVLTRVQALLALKSTKLNAKDPLNERTPLVCAVVQNRLEVTEVLISAGADVNAADLAGSSLMYAAGSGDWGIFTALMAAGADPHAMGAGEISVLTHACFDSHEYSVKIVHALIQRQVELNPRDVFGRTPLMWAAFHGNAGVVSALMAAGADTEAQDNQGSTALSLAEAEGYVEVVSLFNIDRK